MKRLTPKYVTTDFENVEKSTLEYCNGKIPMFAGRSVLDYIHRLAELEDELENGTLVKLPAPLGSELWHIALPKSKIGTDMVTVLDYNRAKVEKNYYPLSLSNVEMVGKNYFLSREEAEKRLEELKG